MKNADKNTSVETVQPECNRLGLAALACTQHQWKHGLRRLCSVKPLIHGSTLYDHTCMTDFVCSYMYLTHSHTHYLMTMRHVERYDTWLNIVSHCMSYLYDHTMLDRVSCHLD